MSYQDLTHKIQSRNILFSVLLELTYKCNLDCFFCYNDRGIAGVPLSTEQYFRFLEDLRDMAGLPAQQKGSAIGAGNAGFQLLRNDRGKFDR